MKNSTEKALGKTPNKETKREMIAKISNETNKRMTERLLKERNL